MDASRADIASFYWIALGSGLISPESPIRWADEQIAAVDVPDIQMIELSLASGRPLRHLLDALRVFGSVPTPTAFRFFGGLLHDLVADGTLNEHAAAKQLYGLYSQYGSAAADVLGRVICCIDEYFDPYLQIGDGPAEVRGLLEPFAAIELPPLSPARG